MGRVNRLMERRVLRRAADEALLTPAFIRSINISSVTPSAPQIDTVAHVDDADPWGLEPDTDAREPVDAITEPIAVTALHDRLRNAPDDFRLDEVPPTAPATDLPASAAIGTPKPALVEPRRVRVGPPWYLTKPAALAAVAVVAIVGAAVLAMARGADRTVTVRPDAATTATARPSSGQPAPSRVPPAASNAPAAAPPSLPPPPSATPASPAPVVRNDDSWTPSPPSPTKKPEIGVTRAPSFSATPPPPPAPPKNSATPGDAPKHHWGLW